MSWWAGGRAHHALFAAHPLPTLPPVAFCRAARCALSSSALTTTHLACLLPLLQHTGLAWHTTAVILPILLTPSVRHSLPFRIYLPSMPPPLFTPFATAFAAYLSISSCETGISHTGQQKHIPYPSCIPLIFAGLGLVTSYGISWLYLASFHRKCLPPYSLSSGTLLHVSLSYASHSMNIPLNNQAAKARRDLRHIVT